MEKYRYWDILDEMPEGWQIDKTAGSPCPNTVFITNGKSVLDGQKRALLKLSPTEIGKKKLTELKTPTETQLKEVQPTETEISHFPAKTANQLARLKFKEQIMKEILFDLMVCEIEGWDKKEYILEIRKLLNSIDVSSKPKTVTSQQKLF